MRVGINLSGQCHVMPVPAWCLAKAACVTLPGHWMPGTDNTVTWAPLTVHHYTVTSHHKQLHSQSSQGVMDQ